MKYLFLFLLDVMIVGLYVYTILLPDKDKLDAKHRKWFDMGDSIFGALLRGTKSLAKPVQVGPDLKLELGPIILMAILALVNLLFFIR